MKTAPQPLTDLFTHVDVASNNDISLLIYETMEETMQASILQRESDDEPRLSEP